MRAPTQRGSESEREMEREREGEKEMKRNEIEEQAELV